MATNRRTLYSDLLLWLKEQLNLNIEDPISATRGNSSRFVMTSYPDREVKYPLITLEITDTQESRAGMQTTAMDILLTLDIRVWCKSVGQSDKITQEVMDFLANLQFTDINGSVDNDFHDFNINSVIRVDEPGQRGVKSRIIQLNYKFFNC